MPTTPLLLITHIIQGQSQKEVVANQAFDQLESAITGAGILNAAGLGSTIVSDIAARPMFQSITGVLTGNKTLQFPQRSKIYVLTNNTTGDFDLLIDTGVGNPLKIARGMPTWIYCDGTNCVDFLALLSDHTRVVVEAGDVEGFDRVIYVDATAASFTINLPATVAVGRKITIIKVVEGVNVVTISRNGNTINGLSADLTITTEHECIEVIGGHAGNWVAYRPALA